MLSLAPEMAPSPSRVVRHYGTSARPGDAPGLTGVDVSAEYGFPLVLELGKGHRCKNRFQTMGQFLPHLPRACGRGLSCHCRGQAGRAPQGRRGCSW